MKLEQTFNIWYVQGSDGGMLIMNEHYNDMTTAGWVKLREHAFSMEIDVESEMGVAKIVEGLKECQSTIRAKAGVMCTSIDQTISQLLRLDYTPPADSNAEAMKTIEPD